MTTTGKQTAIAGLTQAGLITMIILGAGIVLKYRLHGSPSKALAVIKTYGLFSLFIPLVWSVAVSCCPSSLQKWGLLLGWGLNVFFLFFLFDILFGTSYFQNVSVSGGLFVLVGILGGVFVGALLVWRHTHQKSSQK